MKKKSLEGREIIKKIGNTESILFVIWFAALLNFIAGVTNMIRSSIFVFLSIILTASAIALMSFG